MTVELAALGRATQDIVAVIPTSLAALVLKNFNIEPQGVQFVADLQVILSVVNAIESTGRAKWFPGGSISNTLFSVGTCQRLEGDNNMSLFWLGPTEFSDFAGSVSPIDFLRRVNVKPYCIHENGYRRITICCISEETRDVVCVLVYGKTAPIYPKPYWPRVDVLLTSVAEVVAAEETLFSYILNCASVALIVADHPYLERFGRSRLEMLAERGVLKWLFGQQEDYIRLGIASNNTLLPPFQEVEVIGTQGSNPVKIWDVSAQAFRDFIVPSVDAIAGNTLGAGDAYAGGYLHARLLGKSIEQAHGQGFENARLVFNSPSAHITPENDLNELFGSLIKRSSPNKAEGELFEKIRLAPGLVVISCGQTGVDQLALQAASDLGLGAYAIMPLGRRTENTEGIGGDTDFFGDAYVIELSSGSYRYCTWANVYFSDATIILDYQNSEGSRETIRACEYLNRPYLNIGGLSESEIPVRIAEWAKRHNVRILNIAGNRQRLLSATQYEEVRTNVDLILRTLARRRAKLVSLDANMFNASNSNPDVTGDRRNLRVGFPNARDSRLLAQRFLCDTYNLDTIPSRKLYALYNHLHLECYFFRARDLPRMLQENNLDVIYCGSDLLQEEGIDADILMNTGLQPCSVVLVGEADAVMDGLSIASQYPYLAQRLLASYQEGKVEIRPINGTAEAWIKSGVANSSIDTWRTGYTCEVNGLKLLRVFFSTALVVACKNYPEHPLHAQIVQLLKDFEVWLETASKAVKGEIV